MPLASGMWRGALVARHRQQGAGGPELGGGPDEGEHLLAPPIDIQSSLRRHRGISYQTTEVPFCLHGLNGKEHLTSRPTAERLPAQ